jgi:hypothetical protein
MSILQQYKPDVIGKGFLALTSSALRDWHKNKDKYFNSFMDPDKSTKIAQLVMAEEMNIRRATCQRQIP